MKKVVYLASRLVPSERLRPLPAPCLLESLVPAFFCFFPSPSEDLCPFRHSRLAPAAGQKLVVHSCTSIPLLTVYRVLLKALRPLGYPPCALLQARSLWCTAARPSLQNACCPLPSDQGPGPCFCSSPPPPTHPHTTLPPTAGQELVLHSWAPKHAEAATGCALPLRRWCHVAVTHSAGGALSQPCLRVFVDGQQQVGGVGRGDCGVGGWGGDDVF